MAGGSWRGGELEARARAARAELVCGTIDAGHAQALAPDLHDHAGLERGALDDDAIDEGPVGRVEILDAVALGAMEDPRVVAAGEGIVEAQLALWRRADAKGLAVGQGVAPLVSFAHEREAELGIEGAREAVGGSISHGRMGLDPQRPALQAFLSRAQ